MRIDISWGWSAPKTTELRKGWTKLGGGIELRRLADRCRRKQDAL